MADKIAERIDTLEQRLKELKTQQQRMETRRRAAKARRDRREELRKKILVGAVVLEKVERGEIAEGLLMGWLESALAKEQDRALFGLSASDNPPA